MNPKFYSNGKLLITGEYVVLDGAKALALPTKFGQSLEVEPIDEPKIIWKGIDVNGKTWLDFTFPIHEVLIEKPQITSLLKTADPVYNEEETRLISILKNAQKLNATLFKKESGFLITTKLDFPRNWGLGSSSTLINNIASWANINAFTLLENTFGGSGYDIAAAQNNKPILYSHINNKPLIGEINLNWNFTEQLFFVHLNKKQSSSDAINYYNLQKKKNSGLKSKISLLTIKFTICKNLSQFEKLISEHEQVISEIINKKTIKELLFNDYQGSIKSLGAWGGDFILATGDKSNWEYFKKKGFKTILSFQEMIL
ncbi:MAG: GHMP kinase [Flavobacteriaceae bacterium]|nr:GHMP kinase [Flavobacteriaceae bacterium]